MIHVSGHVLFSILPNQYITVCHFMVGTFQISREAFKCHWKVFDFFFVYYLLSIILMYMYMYVLNIKAVFCCRSFPGIFGTQQEHYMQVIKQMLWQCLQDQSSQQVNFSPPISCFPLCDICLSKPRLTREQPQPLDRWRSLLTSNRPIQHFHKQNTQPMLIRFTNNRATATVKLENT